MEKIVISGLTKVFPASYGSVTALSSVDLVIGEGEFCVLLGPSGCGKTTLVRIMAGLERSTAGEITIARADAGKPLTAMVFQEDSAFPWMTVEENIGYGLRLRGVRRSRIRSGTAPSGSPRCGGRGSETFEPSRMPRLS